MANPAPVGSNVSAGTYRCTNCGYELNVQSVSWLHHALNAMAHDGGKRSPEAIRSRTHTPSRSGCAPAHDDRSHSRLARKPTRLTTHADKRRIRAFR